MLKVFSLVAAICIFSSIAFSSTTYTKTKVVLFDFGNVMAKDAQIAVNPNIVADFVAEQFGITHDQVKSSMKALIPKKSTEDLPESVFWQKFADFNEVPLPENWMKKWKGFQIQTLIPTTELYAYIKKLKNQGYRVALLSNLRPSAAYFLRQWGLVDEFDPVFFSSDLGMEKPNRDIYEHVLKVLNVQPEEVVFIDDKLENVEGARRLGIRAFQFDIEKDNVKELISTLDLLE
jgi:HAD superfamily hydrolase (TIGR01509 family)